MKEIYDKLVIDRHIDVLERKAIGGKINLETLRISVAENLEKYGSLPPKLDPSDDSIRYSGYVIFRRDNPNFVIRHFGEVSYDSYQLISEESFYSISDAISRYIFLEFQEGIDGIPFENFSKTPRDNALETLIAAGIPSLAYSLDGADHFENYGIQQNGYTWTFYYSERGTRRVLQEFRSDKEAYTQLCTKLIEQYSRPHKYRNSDEIIFECTGCRNLMKMPRIEKLVQIKCRKCGSVFMIDVRKMKVKEYDEDM